MEKLDMYIGVMNEIKLRTEVIRSIGYTVTTKYEATDIEVMCLQIRKILELISLASLTANYEEFDNQNVKYQKFWKADLILNDIGGKNPNFYPKPIYEAKSNGITNIENVESGFLTKEEFVKYYEKCGKIMHASNPFATALNYSEYKIMAVECLNKISRLLNSHLVQLIDDDTMYIIHMQEDGDNNAHGYVFGKIK